MGRALPRTRRRPPLAPASLACTRLVPVLASGLAPVLFRGLVTGLVTGLVAVLVTVVCVLLLGSGPVAGPSPGDTGPGDTTRPTGTWVVRALHGQVTLRGAPDARAAEVGSVPDGVRLDLACSAPGSYVRGTVRASRQWDRLPDGRFIPHGYIARAAGAAGIAGNAAAAMALPSCAAYEAARATAAPAPAAPGGAGGDGAPSVPQVGPVGPLSQAPPVSAAQARRARPATPAATGGTGGPATQPAAEPAGTMSHTQFIAAAVPAAQRSEREHGVPASVTLAQAILESGWGRSGLSASDRNFFGMKCFGQGRYAVGCKSYPTWECAPDGTCFTTDASFRVYATAADSFADHGALLARNARYRAAFAYRAEPDRFVAEVHKAGYATDPLYTAKLVNLMVRYDLYRYDAPA